MGLTALHRRVAELEAERDMWRARAQRIWPQFPATHWPSAKPSLSESRQMSYPEYSLSAPKESFHAICNMLISEICDEVGLGYEMPKFEVDWVRRMLNYNVRGGKMNRGLMVLESGLQ